MDLSDWRVCDRLCRRRRCTPAGDLHNRNVFPGEQGDSNLYGYDCILYRKLYHYFSGKLYYEDRRCSRSENDPASEYGSYHCGNPSCPVCKEE